MSKDYARIANDVMSGVGLIRQVHGCHVNCATPTQSASDAREVLLFNSSNRHKHVT
jgi:hypothetical protein